MKIDTYIYNKKIVIFINFIMLYIFTYSVNVCYCSPIKNSPTQGNDKLDFNFKRPTIVECGEKCQKTDTKEILEKIEEIRKDFRKMEANINGVIDEKEENNKLCKLCMVANCVCLGALLFILRIILRYTDNAWNHNMI